MQKKEKKEEFWGPVKWVLQNTKVCQIWKQFENFFNAFS